MTAWLPTLEYIVRVVLAFDILIIGFYIVLRGVHPKTFRTPIGTFIWKVLTWPVALIFGSSHKAPSALGFAFRGIVRLLWLPVWAYKALRFTFSRRRMRKRLRSRKL